MPYLIILVIPFPLCPRDLMDNHPLVYALEQSDLLARKEKPRFIELDPPFLQFQVTHWPFRARTNDALYYEFCCHIDFVPLVEQIMLKLIVCNVPLRLSNLLLGRRGRGLPSRNLGLD